VEERDPALGGPHGDALAEPAGLETAEATSGMAAFLAVVNATMLLAGALGLITGLLFGVLIGRRTAAPPPPPWRRLQR
jgi:hypothetical protein